jgi:hypothetical protein
MNSLSRRLATIAKAWPEDPFRPNMQLKPFLKSLAMHPKLTPKAVAATEALKNDILKNKVSVPRYTTSLLEVSLVFQVPSQTYNNTASFLP